MSELEAFNDTWPSLVLEFRARLNQDTHADPTISSEDDYRDAIHDLCNKYRERDAQRLSFRLRRQHAPIIDLTDAIDESKHLTGSNALSPLIWQLLILSVQGSNSSFMPMSSRTMTDR